MRFREILAIYAVERSKVVHIREEAGGLDDAIKRYTAFCENTVQVLHDLLGLLLDGGCLDLAGLGVDRDLAGGEDHFICYDGLRIRADRSGCKIGMQYFFYRHGNTPL